MGVSRLQVSLLCPPPDQALKLGFFTEKNAEMGMLLKPKPQQQPVTHGFTGLYIPGINTQETQ